jgi:hypothetical protein
MSDKNDMIHVSDSRINKLSDKVTQVVKSGAKTTLQELIETTSSNANTVKFTKQVPSPNILIDRNNLPVKGIIDFQLHQTYF